MAKTTDLAKAEPFRALVPMIEGGSGFDPAAVMRENIGPDGLDPNSLDKVKIPSGGGIAWEIPTLDGTGDIAKTLEVVIVAAQDVRAYYSTRYTGDKNPPDCVSLDAKTGAGEPGGPCATCQHAQWGTAKNDEGEFTDGQACSQKKMMLCLNQDSTLPFVIKIPSGSLGNLSKYFMRLAGANLFYYAVVTRLSLEKKASGSGVDYSTVVPEFVRALSPEEFAGVVNYRGGMLDKFTAIAAADQD